METDAVKQRSRHKPVLQLREEKQTGEEKGVSGGEDDHPGSPRCSPPSCNKDKLQRAKQKNRKNTIFNEDIIDGFAILSFKTLEDLQTVADKQGCIENRTPPVEDNGCPDILLEHTHNVDKTKRRKAKKNPATSNCIGDSCDVVDKPSPANTIISCCSGNNSGNIQTADDSGSHLNGDSNNSGGDGHMHNTQCIAVLGKSLCLSGDGRSDWGVENGDNKASESRSDGTPPEDLQQDLVSKSSLKSCTTTATTASSTTSTATTASSTTSTTLVCNSGVESGSLSVTSVPHVGVATTTTTTTTTSSTSRSGATEPSTSSAAVTTTAVSSQSVIHTTLYFSDHLSSKPSQFPPEPSLSDSNSKLTLPPSHQRYPNSPYCDSSVYATSIQYSPNHRSNHQSHHQSAHHHRSLSSFGRASSSPTHPQSHHQQLSVQNHHQQLYSQDRHQQSYPGSYPYFDVQNTKTSVNHKASDLPKLHTANHFLFDGHHPGSEYLYAYSSHQSNRRPDSHGSHHSSSHEATEPSSYQQCSTGDTLPVTSDSGAHVPTTTTATTTTHLISKPPNPQPKHQHHISRIHPSSPNKPNPDLCHQRSPNSPLAHLSKRPCRSSPGLSAPSTVSTANGLPAADSSKHLTPPPSKSHNSRAELSASSASGVGKDHGDIRIKERSHNCHSGGSHSHHLSRHHKDRDKERQREKDKDRERDRHKITVPLNVSLPQTIFPTPKHTWPSTQVPLYDPLLQLHHPSPLTPSPAIPSLGPFLSPSSTSLPSPLFTLPLAHPPSLQTPGTATLSTGMFAPPIPPALPCLPPTPSLSSHPTGPSQYSADSLTRNPDFLHQDLNNRLLAHRDSNSVALSPSPFIRPETHQHQHQHLHSHMHQHTYGGLSAGPMVPPTPPLIVPNYSAAFTSLLPPGPSGSTLASSLQGAFQPKNVMVPGQVLVPFRDREKGASQPGLTPTQKKQGKWCAVHVRVAWEIFHRQQKKLQRDQDGTASSSSASSALKPGADSKPVEPLLRPPSNLLPGASAIIRPPGSPLLASGTRSLPDGAHASFLSSAANLGMAPFPRPSPYNVPSLFNPLGFSGLGGNMFTSMHDMVPLPLSSNLNPSPNEWNRLHRTPSTFPSWPRSESEKEREREVRKEDERERERRGSLNHQLSGPEDSRHKDIESLRPKSRSRSRSPLRNGRIDHHSKSELGSYEKHYDDRRPHSTSTAGASSRFKEDRRSEEMSSLPHHLAEREKLERFHREKLEKDRFERERHERDRIERERMEKEKLLQSAAAAEREKLLQVMEQREKFFQTGGYLGLSPFTTGLPTHPGFFDRRMGLMGPTAAGYPFLERGPVPTAMWNPYDKSAADIFHRLEVERERERIAMMSRLSNIPSHLAVFEQERLKDHILREQQEREYELRKQYLDRVPSFTAERLRAADPLALGMYFPRTVSPMFMPGGISSLKSNSPHGIPGVPPPLIPSSSSAAAASMLSARSHDNSPSSSSKSKGCSPADSTSDLKDKREGSSTDPDAHSR